MLSLDVFLSARVVDLIFSRNLTRLKYYANWTHGPNPHLSFIRMQSFPNVFLVRMIKNQFHSSLQFLFLRLLLNII